MIDCTKELYTHGYLLTNDEKTTIKRISDLRKWNIHRIFSYSLFVHPGQKSYIFTNDVFAYLLIGHAYNPFTMTSDENEILSKLASMRFGTDEYRDYFDQLTGVFFFAIINESTIIATCDCAGMLGANYALIGDKICFSAYSQMIADIYDLNEDPYVLKLKKSKLFHWYGCYLPGDLTPYQEIKRIVPNTEILIGEKAEIHRFYPRDEYKVINSDSYTSCVSEICTIMNNSLRLVAEKWKRPAISLTGGTDSKTTLACAKGVQECFDYFSYISLPREETDAVAAQNICEALHLRHKIYYIDTDPSHFSDFGEVSDLLERHNAYLGKANENDICKRIELKEKFDFDVEVKSWVSEVARASRYEKYGKKSFPIKIRPRLLTSMYKIFAFNRTDAIRTDKKFAEYLKKTGLAKVIDETGYPWTEFFVWEIVFGGWGGLTLTGEHMLTNEITIPYNNRALLDLMLRVPLEKRMHDHLHKDMMHLMDPRIEQTGIHVVNGNETKKRAVLERLYFDINNLLPF